MENFSEEKPIKQTESFVQKEIREAEERERRFKQEQKENKIYQSSFTEKQKEQQQYYKDMVEYENYYKEEIEDEDQELKNKLMKELKERNSLLNFDEEDEYVSASESSITMDSVIEDEEVIYEKKIVRNDFKTQKTIKRTLHKKKTRFK